MPDDSEDFWLGHLERGLFFLVLCCSICPGFKEHLDHFDLALLARQMEWAVLPIVSGIDVQMVSTFNQGLYHIAVSGTNCSV